MTRAKKKIARAASAQIFNFRACAKRAKIFSAPSKIIYFSNSNKNYVSRKKSSYSSVVERCAYDAVALGSIPSRSTTHS